MFFRHLNSVKYALNYFLETPRLVLNWILAGFQMNLTPCVWSKFSYKLSMYYGQFFGKIVHQILSLSIKYEQCPWNIALVHEIWTIEKKIFMDNCPRNVQDPFKVLGWIYIFWSRCNFFREIRWADFIIVFEDDFNLIHTQLKTVISAKRTEKMSV